MLTGTSFRMFCTSEEPSIAALSMLSFRNREK
jgi:hypothetical protein